MIKEVILKKFKGFREHKIQLESLSILVGQNNAGKTTIIEALRIASLAISRVPAARFEATPDWLTDHSVGPGFYFSLTPIEFDKTFVHYNSFEDEPAQIEVKFTSHHRLKISLSKNEKDAFCQLYRLGKYQVLSRADAAKLKLKNISVMPPIGTLLMHEKIVRDDHVQRHINGRLSHRHIRNQMDVRPDEFKLFRKRLEESWSGVAISALEGGAGDDKNEYRLFIREPAYTSELGRAGSGFQAWVQMLWFLCRTQRDETIVLDEPDVFLHADIQRKLLKLLSSEKFHQVIIATHSIDIISDVTPDSVIIVQKNKETSKSAAALPSVQAAIENIGTIHNIQLAKIAAHGKFLFVEGEDVKYLSELAYKLGPVSYDKFSRVAHDDIGGAGNIQRAIGGAEGFSKVSGGAIRSYLILDRDYKPQGELEETAKKAEATALNLTIWNKKELENFFLIEAAVSRLIADELEQDIDAEEISEIFQSIEDELFEQAVVKRAQAYQEWKRGCGLEKAIGEAKQEIDDAIRRGQRKMDFCSGKAFIAKLSSVLKEKYGVQLNAMALCRECKIGELDKQVVQMLQNLL